MPATPLATHADLEDALGITLPARQAALALRRASSRVRKYCRQQITLVENETVILPGGGRLLWLPQRPVIVDETHPLTVTELFGMTGVEFPALEGREFTRLGNQLTRGYPYYEANRFMGWPAMRQQGIWSERVRVLYSHGHTTVPDDILDVVLDLAEANVTNTGRLRSESIDDYSRTFAAESIGSAQLTNDHKEALRPYRVSTFSVAPVT